MPVIALNGHLCARHDEPGRPADHTLRGFKDAHDDVPCVGDDQHRRGGFEHPFEDDERIEIVNVVLVNDHLNEFERCDDGKDRARNGDDHMIRKTLNHGENAAVPLLLGLAYVVGNTGDLGIHLVEQPVRLFIIPSMSSSRIHSVSLSQIKFKEDHPLSGQAPPRGCAAAFP